MPKLSYPQIMERFSQYMMEESVMMTGPEVVADIMRPILAHLEQEQFHVLLLDTKSRLIHDHHATTGLLDRTQIHAREIFREAIRRNTVQIVLCHNHPSGDPTPSCHDISCTKGLVEAGKIVGIRIIDHVVIGKRSPTRPTDYLSFAEENLM